MHRTLPFIAVLIFASHCLAQSKPGAIGAAAVWEPPDTFLTSANKVCGASSPDRKYLDCLTAQMAKAGAPAAAVNLTREFYKQSHGDIGIMTGFNPVGPVDIAWVIYPTHRPSNYGLFLVNGDPRFVNVEDLKQLDQKAMEQSYQFGDLRVSYPKVGLWPSDRKGHLWPNSQRSPDGGLQFVVGYPLRNGCLTCSNAGAALFTWNFSTDGKFLGTSFMGLTPAPIGHD